MSEVVPFGDFVFTADFSSASRHDGSTVRFTRTERRLLVDLAGHPGVLRTRSQLLDATTEPGSDVSDRNVDFYITRLRSKLGDSARNPAYISTRYGEGYVWIAPRTMRRTGAAGAFIVVGPVKFLEGGAAGGAANRFAESLVQALQAELAEERRVVLDRDAGFGGGSDGPEFQLELMFIPAGETLDCVSMLRRPGHPVLCVRRDHDVANADPESVAAEHLAAVWRAIWNWDGQGHPDLEPIAVRMVGAAAPFARDRDEGLPPEIAELKGEAFPSADLWRVNETRLRKLIDSGMGDAATRLALAVTIHSRYVIDGWRFLASDDPRVRDWKELHDLLLGALPELLKDPQHALSAAKVLTFLGPAYREMALEIAEDAFRRSTALAHALSILGPLRCFSGDFDGGLGLLAQARRLSKPGSLFERYVVSFICQNLLASGDYQGKDRELEGLTRSPLSKGPYRLVYASPGEVVPSLPVRLHLKLSSAKFARATLLWSYTICARHYADPWARENVIVGLAGHLRRRFGDTVVPPEVAAAIPAVLGPDSVAQVRPQAGPVPSLDLRSDQ